MIYIIMHDSSVSAGLECVTIEARRRKFLLNGWKDSSGSPEFSGACQLVPTTGTLQNFNTELGSVRNHLSSLLCWQGTISRVISLDVGDTCEKYAADLGAKLRWGMHDVGLVGVTVSVDAQSVWEYSFLCGLPETWMES